MRHGSRTVHARFISEHEREFTFAICRRKSVYLSVVCLSETFVCPTQATEIFGNVSTPFGTLNAMGVPNIAILTHRRLYLGYGAR